MGQYIDSITLLLEKEQLPKDILDKEGVKLPDDELTESSEYDEQFFAEIAVKDARRAIEIMRDVPILRKALLNKTVATYGSNVFATNDEDIFNLLIDTLNNNGIDMYNSSLDEMSTTANVAGYQTPYAFGTNDNVEMLGYKKVKKPTKNIKKESNYKQISSELFLNERSYKEYKSDPTFSAKQKVNLAIHEINKKLYEIEGIIRQNLKLKSEMKVNNSEFWKSSKNKMLSVSERLVRIANHLKQLNA
jgi:hypothetical protein